jgi:hypothetical protein
MKRVLTILAILLLPLSVWAMTPVNDSDLSNVTGQAGVNINADLTMDISIGTMAWGDNDGLQGVYMPWSTVPTGGYIGMTGFNITNLWIRARTDTSDIYNSYSTLLLKPITIDVATSNGSSDTLAPNGTTFVRFGLGALQISMDALQFEIALGSHLATGYIGTTPTINQSLGVVSLGGIGIWINPWSYVDIYNGRPNNTTTAQGVTFSFNIIVDHFTMDYMSWGDPDGLAGGYGSNETPPPGFKWVNTSTAGYVGLNNFQLGNDTSPAVTIVGSVSIDVLTDASALSTYAALPPLMVYMKSAMKATGYDPKIEASVIAFLNAQNIPIGTPLYQLLAQESLLPASVSVVHISFPNDLVVTVNSMWADVQVDSTYNLGGTVAGGGTNTNGELGDIYIQGFTLDIKAGSWVDIWAH